MFTSRSCEWFTPPNIVERAVALLGAIDLDPCSNSQGHPNVPAARHYTRAQNGLERSWYGRVYLNPPYGRAIRQWVQKLVRAYELGQVTEALALLPARTDTGWFQLVAQYPICFVRGRLRFSGAEHAAPFPSMLVYVGPDPENFARVFADIGDMWTRARPGPVPPDGASGSPGMELAIGEPSLLPSSFAIDPAPAAAGMGSRPSPSGSVPLDGNPHPAAAPAVSPPISVPSQSDPSARAP
jgi:hypothetical protein